MKMVKSLLLGSAAGFAAFTGAQAADLPLAEPVEYVKICSTYGEGFFYIPGTDTCLQISGKVRVDFVITPEVLDNGDGDYFASNARGVVAFDARSETSWGTLRSYIELEGNSSGGAYDDGAQEEHLAYAFVQFAGITAGFSTSFYDYVPYSFIGDFFSAEDVNTLVYTASFGSGFAATVGIEDKYFRANPIDDTAPAGQGPEDLDQDLPNVIAALRVDQAWGSAQISAAYQDNEGDTDVGDDNGWAVQAGASFNVSFFGEGSYVWAIGNYTEGAVSYSGGEEYFFGGPGVFDTDAAGNAQEIWSVGAGVHAQVTDAVYIALGGLYAEGNNVGAVNDFTVLRAEGDIFWTPVDNLDLGLGVIYEDVDFAGAGGETENLAIITRIERGF
jgi:porin-like protein